MCLRVVCTCSVISAAAAAVSCALATLLWVTVSMREMAWPMLLMPRACSSLLEAIWLTTVLPPAMVEDTSLKAP